MLEERLLEVGSLKRLETLQMKLVAGSEVKLREPLRLLPLPILSSPAPSSMTSMKQLIIIENLLSTW